MNNTMVIFPETRSLARMLKCYWKPDKNGAFPYFFFAYSEYL
ncbi:hypothetical protein HMPREF1548_04969 [Clostridium sp. KLE 1755]|nr:hypothetical protein HMPREF1548_04969 [Clostridium sp. KLE 1755]